MNFNDFVEFVVLALTKEKKDEVMGIYLSLLPLLTMRGKYVSFDEFYDTFTGANLDLRPVDEILKESEEIEKRLSNGS